MESHKEIGDLYRKLGFSAARRTQDDLAEVFCRFLSSKRHPGSELGQLLGHAGDTEQVSERLTAEGIADIPAFFAGRWSCEGDTLGDLLLERFLVRDMDPRERAEVTAALEQSADGRQLLDRLLKQRLIFLADYPAERFADRVAELLAAQATPEPRPPRRSLRWISIPVAAVAACTLLGIGLLTQAHPPAPVAAGASAAKPVKTVAMATNPAKPKPVESAARAEPVETEPTTSEPAPILHERGSARLIAYARAGNEVRAIEDGGEINPDERLVTWVKTEEAGYAAVVSVEGPRTRIHFAERGEAIAVPAGGPTRLGKGRSLPSDVELVLLVSSEPFDVRPIVARMRRGAAPAAVFDGAVRRMKVRLAPTEIAAGQ